MSDVIENSNNNIFNIDVNDIMHTAYLQYSLSVNVGRAIPDVRDGLKPCNRRILYAMNEMRLTKSHATVKCAKVVGAVLGSYHPHGDSSVYDALVHMAQDFSLRVPLIEGQGNFGSVDGDPPAAYRYTECRMERIAEEMLVDIEKDTVPMVPTFDEGKLEPEVLPCKFPNLLVNGSMGIGVGMATQIPQHNLGEVCNAAIYLLEHPTATVDELMNYVHGPDFPTGAIICGIGSIHKLYSTGHATLRVRSKATVVENKGKEQIVVTEIPYKVNKELLIQKIGKLVNDKEIVGLTRIRDGSSDKTGIRIVMDVKQGANGNVILNQLFNKTELEVNFACNMLVVDHNRPCVLNLIQILQAFLDHRFDVITKRTLFELKKAEARVHILQGLLIAVDNLDEVIRIIRNSSDRDVACNLLLERFPLSKIQADAILEMRLHQLTGLSIDALQNEFKELMERIDYLKGLLADDNKIKQVISEELRSIVEKYSDPRRTVIITGGFGGDDSDLIPRHSCIVTLSDTGYIKRVPSDTYRSQHRGGSGVIGMGTKENDNVSRLVNAHSHDVMLFFTNNGKMYWKMVYDIPESSRISRGEHVNRLIKKPNDEKICAMLSFPKEMLKQENLSLVMVTRKGVIKKTSLIRYSNLRNSALTAIKLLDDDELIACAIADGSSEIILSTSLGMACHFSETKLRRMGRTARGVRGIRFRLENDFVIGMEVISTGLPVEENPLDIEMPEDEDAEDMELDDDVGAEEALEEEQAVQEEEAFSEDESETDDEQNDEPVDDSRPQLLVVTSDGMGKRSYVDQYRLSGRGVMGVRNILLGEDATVIAAILVHSGDELIFTTKRGQILRTSVDEIRIVGRNSKGVRVFRLGKNDKLIAVSTVMKPSEDDNQPIEDPNAAIFAAAGERMNPNDDDDDEVSEEDALLNENGGSSEDNDVPF